MVPKKLDVESALELSGAEICVNTGTTTELNIADFFRSRGMPYEIVSFEKSDEALKAYEAGRCDVYSTDASGLAAQRLKLSTIGLLQYLAPSGQLALGVLIYGEAFGWIDGVAFALIWTALAIYTFSALRPASPVPKPVSAE